MDHRVLPKEARRFRHGCDALTDATPPLPPEVVPEPTPLEKKEANTTFGEKGRKLDHSLRTLAGYGALLLALVMYSSGLAAIALFLGLFPCIAPPVEADQWHIVVAVLVALFSVPTFLVVAVLRSANLLRKEAADDSHDPDWREALMRLMEKVVDKV